jgi:hypothetical protein
MVSREGLHVELTLLRQPAWSRALGEPRDPASVRRGAMQVRALGRRDVEPCTANRRAPATCIERDMFHET